MIRSIWRRCKLWLQGWRPAPDSWLWADDVDAEITFAPLVAAGMHQITQELEHREKLARELWKVYERDGSDDD
jgi:uncharacterized protein YfiM (DUF2279 family)